MLVFHQPDDYWYLPPALPEGYWVGSFDLRVVRSPAELRQATGGGGRWAVLGECLRGRPKGWATMTRPA